MEMDCTDSDCHLITQERAQAPKQAQLVGKGGSPPHQPPTPPKHQQGHSSPHHEGDQHWHKAPLQQGCAAPRITLPVTGTLLGAVWILVRVTVALILAQKCKAK